ncbi:MAG: oligosaccharide flippase family protein [Hyphomonadaceae bacterium]
MSQPTDKPADNVPHVGSAIRSAMVWNLVTMAFAQIALAAIFLLLTARLNPTTFGIFALAAVMTDLFYSLGSSSAVDAIVQRQDYSRNTLSTVTWTALVICVIVSVAFAVVAEYYAAAIKVPQVGSILEALSLTTLMLPFAIAPLAVMRQRMDFKGLALLNMIASFAGAVTALGVAYTPYVEWSLVVQRLVATLTTITLATIRTSAFPAFSFSFSASGSWLTAVSRIFVGQGVAKATPRMVDLLVGLFFNATMVGYLRVASRLFDIALNLLVNPFAQLWVVLLSRDKDSVEARRSIFLQLSNLTALIALPAFIGLALASKELVALILTPEYAPVAGPLSVLCALGVFVPLTNPRNAVFTALQKFDHLVWYSTLDFAVTLVAMVATASFGPLVMLSSAALASITMIVFALPVILRSLDISKRQLVARLMPPYIAVAIMAVTILAIQPELRSFAPLQVLMIKVGVGVVVYLGVLALFFRRSVFDAFRVVAAR